MKKIVFIFCVLGVLFITGCPEPEAGAKKVTITFDSNGGSELAPLKINKDDSLPADYFTGDKAPTLTGSYFIGWLDGAASTLITTTTKFPEDTTLTAQWSTTKPPQKPGEPIPEGQVLVSFNLGDGVTGTPPGSVYIKTGQSLGNGKFPKDPSRAGWVFLGWYNSDTKYTASTVISTTAATFVLTARWDEDSVFIKEDAQNPAIHPGNHFLEIGITDGWIKDAKVNVNFSASGLFSNIEKGAGVLSSQWYRATSETGAGVEIALRQNAPDTTPHSISLPFTWREETAGEYWYWVKVTNFDDNATVNKYSSSITQNRLHVTVTE